MLGKVVSYFGGMLTTAYLMGMFNRRRACDMADELLRDPEINAAITAELEAEDRKWREEVRRAARTLNERDYSAWSTLTSEWSE